MSQQEHPFAQYIRILGKGRNGSRALTRDEAYHAFHLIMSDAVEPIQLGAFLMLMRVKEESPDEVAAAVTAIRETLPTLPDPPKIDVDWSSYAGKKRILPWYLLATLLMAHNGIRIFMHGASGHTAGRIYTRDILPQLGIPVATSLEQAAEHLVGMNFAYLDLEYLHPKLHQIIEYRPLLGLRSPVHTVARMLNPFNASYVMQGIFHPGYRPTHQEAGMLLGMRHMAVIKGESGEIERNPDQPVLVQSVHDHVMQDEEWPAMFARRHIRPDKLELQDLVDLWRGVSDNEYGAAAVTGTIALTLYTMGRAQSRAEAEQQAWAMWEARNREELAAA